ncbi:unnamed protein product [Bursaphelenchus okinawaensis]|uniref:glutaminase n=1 Tax=Bursaphelenchus okinawaensis TaxID=465554 RepID=A0A811KPN9_9BILA|nr:unnamed protein product [Bursaphelenchus okinawaensis]CAG9109430.1 unnamed protein product [Bursaphelenchus okinawaensis]
MNLPNRRKIMAKLQRVNTIGEILDRKRSVARIMSQTADGLNQSFEFKKCAPEDVVYDLFKVPGKDEASIGRLVSVLKSLGLREDDPRLIPTMEKIKEYDHNMNDDFDVKRYRLPRDQFKDCIHPSISLISQALRNELIVPSWKEFTDKITEIFEDCRTCVEGNVATYIPQLARQDPNRWGLSVCTIDGQRFSIGDAKTPFCFQSVSKAFNYAIVSSDLGSDYVHQFVGHEPSGRLFNEICLDANGKPHNPMINAGAIVVTSLLKNGICMADRYDFAFNEYKKLAGGDYIGFNNATFLSERETACRNFALSFFMMENKCFPPGIQQLREELDLYFQLCSLETHCESAAVMAATLANGGVCPTTGDVCIDSRPCRDVLSLMYSCGMYDYSGQFAFHVGLPAKSGVSGNMIIVIPNLMGICVWSPPLDKLGNSCRGVKFCQKLIEAFNFHNYDSLLHADSQKIDPRRAMGSRETDLVVSLLFACKNGDFETVRRLYIQGENLNVVDYDGRTALHLAACEGHANIVKFLLQTCNVDHSIQDRWGRTALDDARLFHHHACTSLLLRAGKPNHHGGSKSKNKAVSDAAMAATEIASSTSEEEPQGCGVMMLGSGEEECEEVHKPSFHLPSLTSSVEDVHTIPNGLIPNGSAIEELMKNTHINGTTNGVATPVANGTSSTTTTLREQSPSHVQFQNNPNA